MSSRLLRSTAVAAASLVTIAPALPAAGSTAPRTAQSAANTVPQSAAKPNHYPARAALAATWQVSQLSHGRIRNLTYKSTDWGLTIDTGFMLAADRSHAAVLSQLTRAVEKHYGDYTSFGGAKSAGAIGKTLLFVRVVGKNPDNFAGVNVRQDLQGLRVASGPDKGRFSDTGKHDYSNNLGQAYDVLGLARTGGVPSAGVQFLLKQRCPQGFFRLYPVTGQTCRQSSSAPDIDTTSLAVQALLSARQHGATVPNGIIGGSVRWLLKAQRRNGSFGGGLTTLNSNSNSTGLAANALAATGNGKARLQAARWVSGLQITGTRAGNGPAHKDIGAIAYRPPALHRALKSGIGVKKRDQFRRATPQAYFALAPAPLTTLHAPRQ